MCANEMEDKGTESWCTDGRSIKEMSGGVNEAVGGVCGVEDG